MFGRSRQRLPTRPVDEDLQEALREDAALQASLGAPEEDPLGLGAGLD